jgi:3-phenylpropionate/trans-cinnamate dioxygenase ferredoxin subunit
VAFVKVAQTSEIAPGSMKRLEHNGQEILLANVGGTFYAISERCTHLGGHLSRGTIQDGIVTCPRHGSRFDVRTGQAVNGATILFLHMDVKNVRSYPVKIVGNDVLIDSEK